MVTIISTEELQEQIKESGDYVLIDVRRKEELEHGMIPTAHNIPLDEIQEAFALDDASFQEKYNFQKPKKEDRVICHCRSGGRSQRAATYLESIGYSKATNYQGSIKEWSQIDDNVEMY